VLAVTLLTLFFLGQHLSERIGCPDVMHLLFSRSIPFENVTCEGKIHPATDSESPEWSRGITVTSALDGGWWSTPRLGCFTPAKETQYPFYRRLGGPQGRSGQVRKISPTSGFDPTTVLSIASRYSVYAITAPLRNCNTPLLNITSYS